MVFTNISKSIAEVFKPKTDIGMLEIKGMINNSDFYIKHIHKFLKASNVKALLLKIDSSGGFPGTSQALFNELMHFKKEKPIVVLIENICASGAYYVASTGNHLIANPSSMIGSIGVILGLHGMPLPNLKDLMDDWKIKFHFIQSGKYKSAGNLFKENSPSELNHLQNLANSTYEQFVNDIAKARNLDPHNKNSWAEGKIFTGTQALKLKMIDQLGSMRDALAALKKEAKIETEIRLLTPKKATGLMSLFSGDESYGTETVKFSDIIAETISSVYEKFLALQAHKSQAKILT